MGWLRSSHPHRAAMRSLHTGFTSRSPSPRSTSTRSCGLFAGADTVLGPVYAGLGFGYGGNASLYVFLGRPY